MSSSVEKVQNDILISCEIQEEEVDRFYDFFYDQQTEQEKREGRAILRNDVGPDKIDACRMKHDKNIDKLSIIRKYSRQLAESVLRGELEAPMVPAKYDVVAKLERMHSDDEPELKRRCVSTISRSRRFVINEDEDDEGNGADRGETTEDVETTRVVCALGICDYETSSENGSVVLFNWHTIRMIDEIFHKGAGASFRTLCDRVNEKISWTTHSLTPEEIDRALYICRGKESPSVGDTVRVYWASDGVWATALVEKIVGKQYFLTFLDEETVGTVTSYDSQLMYVLSCGGGIKK